MAGRAWCRAGWFSAFRLAGSPQKKWGPALLPAPTAPSEGYAGVRNLVDSAFRLTYPLSILAHQLRRRFPSSRSLFRGTWLIYPTTWPESSLVVRSARPVETVAPTKTTPCSAALLGETALASRFAHQVPKNPGAASRERQLPLPAPLPGWPRPEPESSVHCLPAEIGPLVTCRTLLVLADIPRRPGPPSRSHEHHAQRRRVAEAKFSVISLWITGISVATVGTFRFAPLRLPFRSPLPTSYKCLNRLCRLLSPLICRA
jgi:hypothetical protein